MGKTEPQCPTRTPPAAVTAGTDQHLAVRPVGRKGGCLHHVFQPSNIKEICFRFLIIQDWFQVLPENGKFFHGILFLQFLSFYI